MSDDRARDLERVARRTGSLVDRAAVLRARVRAGELAPERLELVAYLGHDAALAAIGWSCRDAQGCDGANESPPMWCRACAWRDATTGHWAIGMARFGREACVRVAVAAARTAQAMGCRRFSYQVEDGAEDGGGDGAPPLHHQGDGACVTCERDERAVAAAEAWALCPCAPHLTAVREREESVSGWVLTCARVIEGALGGPASPLVSCLSDCSGLAASDATFRAELCDAVAAWALA